MQYLSPVAANLPSLRRKSRELTPRLHVSRWMSLRKQTKVHLLTANITKTFATAVEDPLLEREMEAIGEGEGGES